jgi:Ni,Fe-hydrogenase I cytochrome b subunit
MMKSRVALWSSGAFIILGAYEVVIVEPVASSKSSKSSNIGGYSWA